ncbi:MAG: hypothetical protein ACFFDN_44015 [Candidatus Hodarchaeota archaeon]
MLRISKIRAYFIFIISLIVLIGCATYKPFMAPGFSGSKLTEGGVAVFPVLVGEGSTSVPGIESYLRGAGEELANSLRKSQPSLKVVGPTEVSAALAKSGLVDDFAKLKQTFQMTGMLDSESAKKIVEPLQIKYFMLSSINSLFAKDKSTAGAQMSAKIFDSAEGQMVFETLGSGEEISIFGGPPYEKAVKKATQSISRNLMFVYKQK